jgi:hypothetical protein
LATGFLGFATGFGLATGFFTTGLGLAAGFFATGFATGFLVWIESV